MKIVFDTNILHFDFFLRNAQIVDICETSRQYGIDVYIPEVVYDEMVNQYLERIEEVQKEIDSKAIDLRGISTSLSLVNPIDEANKAQMIRDYPSILNKKLEDLGIKKLPYPNISHKEVVDRDLKRRRPFQKSGKGYRDALIWESILTIIDKTEDDPNVIFLNKNTHDFFEKGDLHPDLKQDLTLKGLKSESLKIYDNLNNAITNHIRPLQERIKELLDKFSGSSAIGGIDIKEYLLNSIEDDLNKILSDEDNCYTLGTNLYFENPEFNELVDVSCEIKDIHYLTSDQIIVDVEASVLVNVEGYLHKADYPLIAEDKMPTIIDSDWNRHYMLVWDTIKFPIRISLVVDSDLTEVLNHSIDLY